MTKPVPGQSVEAHAGVALGTRMAYDATVHTGSPLSQHLLEAAREASARAASADEGSDDVLRASLVAILCAHAALEARLNEAATSANLGTWWDGRERWPIERKWGELIKELTGVRPNRGVAARKAVARLCEDRNGIAHHRGVLQPDGTIAVSGPPVVERGGITGGRAHYDAVRAADRVTDAEAAMAAIP